MHPRKLIGALLAVAALLGAAKTSPASAAEFAMFDSPDGDPPIHETLLPASRFALLPPSDGPMGVIAGGARAADFVLTGVLPEGDTATAVAFTPDGTKIVVAHRDTRNLIVFDAATRAFLEEIALSGSPQDLAIAPDGVHAVTANLFEDTASIVDLVAGGEIANVAVGDQPGVVRITPDGTTAVVGNTIDGTLSVIDIAAASEVRRISGTGFVLTLSVNFESGAITVGFNAFELAGNTKAVHADYFAGQIDVVDIAVGTVTSLSSPANPRSVAITPDGAKAVVSHIIGIERVSVVDPVTPAITKTIAVGADLFGPVAIDPTGTKAVVAIQNACRVVNLITDAVSASLNTLSVSQIVTTADGDYALTVGFSGALISYAGESVVNQLNNIVSVAAGGVSPVEPRAAMAANLFAEDMVVVNTNGAAGFIEGIVPSGPPPEGDKARTFAFTPDGAKAVVAGIFSDNASIVDVASLSVEAVVAVGDRPAEVAITPDGATAVVANLDSDFVSIIDVASHGVTNIPISRRASQVEISPDGVHAYIAVVASGDGVWRVNLNTLAVEGPKLATGDMGGVLYLFNQTSGLTLSHDGATLVTCNSFTDTITLINTATWSVVATVAVGDFPVRAIFSADDSRIYISNRDSDTITIVSNAGPFSAPLATIHVGDYPFEMALSPGGGALYVANFQAENIGVVDLASELMTTTYPLPNAPQGIHLDAAGSRLFAATGTWSVSVGPGPVFSIGLEGELSILDAASGVVIDQESTGLPPAMSEQNAAISIVGIPSPFGDGLTLVEVPGAIAVDPAGAIGSPSRLTLAPNPFVERAVIEYWIGTAGEATLTVHDVAGRRVVALAEGPAAPGHHAAVWEGRDSRGARVAPGRYFVRLAAPDGEVVSRVAILE
jgi:YVTN family beta-propeller protein